MFPSYAITGFNLDNQAVNSRDPLSYRDLTISYDGHGLSYEETWHCLPHLECQYLNFVLQG